MDTSDKASQNFPKLFRKMQEVGIRKSISEGTEILREGQFVKVIPLVQSGLIKVFTRHEDRELLLYYIRPYESCIMSFSAGINNEPSEVFAVTEEDTEVLLIPVSEVQNLVKDNPNGNHFFFQQYKARYAELLDTIHHVLFSKIDARLYKHLKDKAGLKGENPLRISHQQLASELGTVREVISRVMKKLEGEGLVRQIGNTIQVFNR
ncbi:Crp/Fnr family transcriptional regulator [Lentiprolixibacter aurantiacus]|uniref:Crp/Fnr family transcriptional regulator n=1 Tax=Lentiprolixibacter aurantiacus TaxID=2993939 RepID=A0AAE3SQA9_9FLAO|nr:Crp/Fnr family transcriptional regulator [Lentiprolixibacter aurantiacus]MCX2720332.1 Crp/Fnr family transcriptional regulator [Lentiprolixibacter aurantiacus]